MKTIYHPEIHKITVIFLHGFNQGVSDVEYMTGLIHCDAVRWVIMEGKNMKWYNYYTQRDNHNRHDKINYTQFTQSCEYLKKTIECEIGYIEPHNLYLIGTSQGGTVCINTAINLNVSLGGVICIDTIFLTDYMSDISFVKQVFYVLISTKDKVYNPNFQNVCYDMLRFLGNDIYITKRTKEHTEDTPEICNYINNILQKNKLLKNLIYK
tara:strand:+ start:1400 stop:2029 length:630 start_codon:yes stop_codon:yes gene_type:complete